MIDRRRWLTGAGLAGILASGWAPARAQTTRQAHLRELVRPRLLLAAPRV